MRAQANCALVVRRTRVARSELLFLTWPFKGERIAGGFILITGIERAAAVVLSAAMYQQAGLR